jgi:hypothetical protein
LLWFFVTYVYFWIVSKFNDSDSILENTMVGGTPNSWFDMEFTIYRKAQASGSKLILTMSYIIFALRAIFIGLCCFLFLALTSH